jgi:hypothetical protein
MDDILRIRTSRENKKMSATGKGTTAQGSDLIGGHPGIRPPGRHFCAINIPFIHTIE